MFGSLARRCRWAWQGFFAERAQPVLDLGQGLVLDLRNDRLIIPHDLHVTIRGNLRIHTMGDLIVNTGDTLGSQGKMFLNCQSNPQGDPLLQAVELPGVVDHDPQ